MPTDLRSELRVRAERTAEEILAEARTRADRIEADAERQIEEKRHVVLTKKDRELQAEARAKVAAARHAAMRAVLLAKAEVVNRVLEEAKARLPTAAQRQAYRSVLERELGEAVSFLGEQGGVARCSKKLETAIRELARKLPNVSVQTDDAIASGFRVVGADGSVVIDATLETRLDRLASTLAIEIHQGLEEI